MKSQRSKYQMNLSNILAMMIPLAVTIWYYVDLHKEMLALKQFMDQGSTTVKEVRSFYHWMYAIADQPPDGLDPEVWRSAIDEVSDEPFAHPLWGGDLAITTPDELIAHNASLSRTNQYLESVVAALPIDVESLPAVRERILRDLDSKKRLVNSDESAKNSRNCDEKFAELMKTLIKSRQDRKEKRDGVSKK